MTNTPYEQGWLDYELGIINCPFHNASAEAIAWRWEYKTTPFVTNESNASAAGAKSPVIFRDFYLSFTHGDSRC